jgi:ParB family chromosome partitioning protein
VSALAERWRNSIVRYGEEAPDQLLAHPHNAKIHPRAQTKALAAAITELGWLAPVVVNEQTGHTIDGHARIGEAIARGEPTIPVAYVSLPPEQEALALATLDPIGSLAVHDKDALDALLRGASTGDAVLQGFLADFAAKEGIQPPDFQPVPMEEQGRLDQKQPVTCPACGHAFVP